MTYLIPLIIYMICPQIAVPEYKVKRVKEDFEITGNGLHEAWEHATLLTDFRLPWQEALAQPTTFRALWSDSSIYILFEALDADLVNLGSQDDVNGVKTSDRVELFFNVASQMNPYYCIEVDGRARIYDYRAQYHRKMFPDWEWPQGHLEVKASTNRLGYMVELKISIQSLKDLRILNDDNSMDVGLFRGDFYYAGTRRRVRWSSWVPPNATRPDFHIPSSFGRLLLID